MKKLNFKDNFIEPFAKKVIANSYNEKYIDFQWNEKHDDFDFTSLDNTTALEVTLVIPQNIKTVVSYENSNKPKPNTIKDAKFDDYGNLHSYYGGSIAELKILIMQAIQKKNKKAKKRLKKYDHYELCLCVDDGGLFEHNYEIDFIKEHTSIFEKIFIITASCFFVLENNIITQYKRIIN